MEGHQPPLPPVPEPGAVRLDDRGPVPGREPRQIQPVRRPQAEEQLLERQPRRRDRFRAARRRPAGGERVLPVAERPTVPEAAGRRGGTVRSRRPRPPARNAGDERVRGGPAPQVGRAPPVLGVVAGAVGVASGEVGRLVRREPRVREGAVDKAEEDATLGVRTREPLPGVGAAAERGGRLDGEFVPREVGQPRKRRRLRELVPDLLRPVGGSAVDQVERDPVETRFGEPGHGAPDIGRGVRAPQEPQPGFAERLGAEADAGDSLRGPLPGAVPGGAIPGRHTPGATRRRRRARRPLRRQVFRIRFERGPRGGRRQPEVGGGSEDLGEEPRRRERRRAPAEIDGIRRRRRALGVRPEGRRLGAQPEFREERLPVCLEAAPGSRPAERRHREVAVRTDAPTERDMEVETGRRLVGYCVGRRQIGQRQVAGRGRRESRYLGHRLWPGIGRCPHRAEPDHRRVGRRQAGVGRRLVGRGGRGRANTAAPADGRRDQSARRPRDAAGLRAVPDGLGDTRNRDRRNRTTDPAIPDRLPA